MSITFNVVIKLHLMTIEHLNSLDEMEQHESVWDGICIGYRQEATTKLLLTRFLIFMLRYFTMEDNTLKKLKPTNLPDVLQPHYKTTILVALLYNPISMVSIRCLLIFNIGSRVWLNSVSTFNHHVDVLMNTLGNNAVLLAHKTHKLSYFGWYRMSQASATSEVTDLLIRTTYPSV